MSLYDELIQLQILPDSFAEWANYRHAITDYLLQHTHKNSSFAIFGAGRCHDMDLLRMTEHFSSITLIDENMHAMQDAINIYGLGSHPDIHLIQSDFTGITPDDYRALSDGLTSIYHIGATSSDIHILAEYVLDKLNWLYSQAISKELDFGLNSFDYSATFGVHSQINNMAAWLFSVFSAQLNQSDSSVESRIIDANQILIPRLNDAILKATKSIAFFGCEMKNASISGSIQGACQCIDDLRGRGIITAQAITYWPFDIKQDKIYQMLIQQADCATLY